MLKKIKLFTKQAIKCLTIGSIISLLATSLSFAENDIKVFTKGIEIKFDVPPQIQNGRTLVPLRKIFESLGAIVEWDGSTGTITGKKDNTVIILLLNSRQASVNNKTINLDSPAISVNGRTLVPTRFIAESLGCNVNWDGVNRRVDISVNAFNIPNISPIASTNSTVNFETILQPQTGLEKLLPKYIKSTNMSERWYDNNGSTGYSTKGAGKKETNVEFIQPLNIKELYMYTESATYNFDFIDSNNNSFKIAFPTVEMSKFQKANYGLSSYEQHRIKLDLKNIIRVRITIGELFKTGESSLSPSQITDFTREFELNGTI